MISVNLICVGKVKEKYIKSGFAEFEKRLSSYIKFKVIELKEDGNDSDRESSINKESLAIMEELNKKKAYNILLDIDGKEFSSEEMAEKIEDLSVKGNSSFNFVIGGSYGVSDDLKRSMDLRLTFSKMTFPHQLMRLIFIEQLYRWFSILKNTKYHK
jgi:23S rRNA (pseudouridine1915-N3)-methyltransferase